MDINEFPVYPNIKKYVTICKARWQILEMKLFESVRIAVYLYDDRGIVIESKQFLITGEEYKAWANDDTYLLRLIKQKIQDAYI